MNSKLSALGLGLLLAFSAACGQRSGRDLPYARHAQEDSGEKYIVLAGGGAAGSFAEIFRQRRDELMTEIVLDAVKRQLPPGAPEPEIGPAVLGDGFDISVQHPGEVPRGLELAPAQHQAIETAARRALGPAAALARSITAADVSSTAQLIVSVSDIYGGHTFPDYDREAKNLLKREMEDISRRYGLHGLSELRAPSVTIGKDTVRYNGYFNFKDLPVDRQAGIKKDIEALLKTGLEENLDWKGTYLVQKEMPLTEFHRIMNRLDPEFFVAQGRFSTTDHLRVCKVLADLGVIYKYEDHGNYRNFIVELTPANAKILGMDPRDVEIRDDRSAGYLALLQALRELSGQEPRLRAGLPGFHNIAVTLDEGRARQLIPPGPIADRIAGMDRLIGEVLQEGGSVDAEETDKLLETVEKAWPGAVPKGERPSDIFLMKLEGDGAVLVQMVYDADMREEISGLKGRGVRLEVTEAQEERPVVSVAPFNPERESDKAAPSVSLEFDVSHVCGHPATVVTYTATDPAAVALLDEEIGRAAKKGFPDVEGLLFGDIWVDPCPD